MWQNFGGELETPAASTSTAAHVPAVPTTASAAATSTTTTPGASTTSPDTAVILNKLTALESSLDSRLEAKLKDYIPAAKLGDYREELLTLAIKSADDYATVRESHRAEFNELLDRTAFEKFVADQKAANISFRSMSEAHDVFVKDKRVAASAAAEKAKIDAAVAEALKQARSAGTVPGQTQSVAMSAAQQVLAKARSTAAGGNGETNAMKVARQLEELERNRATVQ